MKIWHLSFMLVAMISSFPAQASLYNFSFTPDATHTITGSFSGTANGDIITNLSNISVYYQGSNDVNIPFNGNGNLSPWVLVAGCCFLPDASIGTIYPWGDNYAQASFSGYSNNFIFGVGGVRSTFNTNGFVSAGGQTMIEGLVNVNFISPNPSNWSVTAVPLPATILLFFTSLLSFVGINRKRSK